VSSQVIITGQQASPREKRVHCTVIHSLYKGPVSHGESSASDSERTTDAGDFRLPDADLPSRVPVEPPDKNTALSLIKLGDFAADT